MVPLLPVCSLDSRWASIDNDKSVDLKLLKGYQLVAIAKWFLRHEVWKLLSSVAMLLDTGQVNGDISIGRD